MKRYFAFALALLTALSLLPSVFADSPHTHVWKEVKRTQPTCTETGQITYKCSCGRSKWETIPALGHEWAKKVYTGYADCEHYGVFYWVCSRCGAHSGMGNDKPLGHDWDESKVIKKPTATAEGLKKYTCKRDSSHTKTEAIPATGETGIHPSLKLSVLGDYALYPYYIDNFGGADVDIGIDAILDIRLTNTGDVPLYIVGNSRYDGVEIGYIPYFTGHDSGDRTLAAEEVYNDENRFGLRHKNLYYFTDVDRTAPTPDDPFHEAKVTISFWYSGYDTENTDDLNEYEPLCQSNVCTFTVYIPREGVAGEPLGIKALKTEAHAPANGEYYELGETIDYIITLTNDSGNDVFGLAVYDSLAGFEPIAAAETFAHGETKQFEYSTVITEDEIIRGTAVNGAVITFSYGNDASATPRFSNHVYSKAGNTEYPETARFDTAKLDAVPAYTSEAETEEYRNAEAEKLYKLLWEAGDDEVKCAVLEERAMFYAYLEAVNGGLSDDVVSFRKNRAEALYGRLAQLAGADEEERLDAPEGLTGTEFIAEILRLKCVSLSELINTVK